MRHEVDRALTRLLPIIGPLGVARATQIALHDDIVRRPRAVLIRRSHERRDTAHAQASDAQRAYWADHPDEAPYAYRAKLLTCPWCMSVWLGAATVIGLRYAPRTTTRILGALALSLTAVAVDMTIDAVFPEDTDDPSPHEPAPPEVAAAFAVEEG